MKKYILQFSLILACVGAAYAHQPFTLVSSEKKTISAADLSALEKNQTQGKKDKGTLTFTERTVRLVVLTGSGDDSLSYVVQGVRNPIFAVPSGVEMRILFVNVDTEMPHDLRFGHVEGEFPVTPSIAETAGSTKLRQRAADVLQAEELVIRASQNGIYKYFCSLRGHAQGGMWGNIAVGVKPGDLKVAPKTVHVHTDDEDHAKPHDHPPATEQKKPAEKKPVEHNHDVKPSPTPHQHGAAPEEKKPAEHAHEKQPAAPPHNQHAAEGMKMSSTVNIGDPMEREASGTAWNPDSSPVYGRMKMYKDGGMLMLMGIGFLRYTTIGSDRDVSIAGEGSRSRVDAPTMFMAMYSRPLTENSQLGFRAMASLDPIIQRGYGYPLLYQSAETFRGQPIHDRQHPHDFISELAVTYSYKFDDKKSFFVYAGLPGEPALGPPMYLHRASGMNNPDAPIGHHWQDATHISYGVVTAGFSFGKAKIEASAFNGREPNENRWNFDRPRLNSFSGRFSFNPTKDLSFQISHGYLRDPEPAEPEIRILRKTTASAIWNKPLGEDKNLASSFIWGQNYANGERSNSFLFESNYDFYKNAVFARFETVKKSGHELVLDHPLDHEAFWVQAFSAGYVRDIVQNKGLDVGLGGMLTINHNPRALAPVYGGQTHAGWQLFVRLRPSKIKH
jgi:hypothetical protein